MRVAVKLSLEIDADVWRDLYGVDNVREDVKRYAVYQLAASAAAEEGAILDVTQTS